MIYTLQAFFPELHELLYQIIIENGVKMPASEFRLWIQVDLNKNASS